MKIVRAFHRAEIKLFLMTKFLQFPNVKNKYSFRKLDLIVQRQKEGLRVMRLEEGSQLGFGHFGTAYKVVDLEDAAQALKVAHNLKVYESWRYDPAVALYRTQKAYEDFKMNSIF